MSQEESVSRYAQRRVVMKATPAASLVVIEPELLFELLVITLDAPTHLGGVRQVLHCRGRRQCRQPILQRLRIALRPLDQQPLFLMRRVAPVVTVRDTYTRCRKARAQRAIRAFSPSDAAPRPRGQRQRQFLQRQRLMIGIAPQALSLAPPALAS